MFNYVNKIRDIQIKKKDKKLLVLRLNKIFL